MVSYSFIFTVYYVILAFPSLYLLRLYAPRFTEEVAGPCTNGGHVAHSVALHDLAGGEGGYGATVAGPQRAPWRHRPLSTIRGPHPRGYLSQHPAGALYRRQPGARPPAGVRLSGRGPGAHAAGRALCRAGPACLVARDLRGRRHPGWRRSALEEKGRRAAHRRALCPRPARCPGPRDQLRGDGGGCHGPHAGRGGAAAERRALPAPQS